MIGARLPAGLGVTAILAIGAAALAASPRPPAGWEAAPIPAPRSPVDGMPACCGRDETCCSRQAEVNGAAPTPVAQRVDVALSELPVAVVRTAGPGEVGVPDAPALRIMDGLGRPPPWPKGPHGGEVRFVPPGRVGEIRVGDTLEPFFERAEARQQGYGVTRSADEDGDLQLLDRSFSFLAIAAGPSGTLSVDLVEGELDARLRPITRTWIHADARPLTRGLYAYREPAHAALPIERVHVVGPEVVRAFEATEVTLRGAFFPSRFSRSWSFSDYALPAAPGSAAFATFHVGEQSRVAWEKDLGVAVAERGDAAMLLDVSQASTDGAAVLRLRAR